MKKRILIAVTLSFSLIACAKKENTETQNTPNEEVIENLDSEATILDTETEAFSKITLRKEFDDLKGKKISFQNILKQHHGRPIVIDVWASWCPDCIKGFPRSEEHTSELQSRPHLVCRLLLEKKKKKK